MLPESLADNGVRRAALREVNTEGRSSMSVPAIRRATGATVVLCGGHRCAALRHRTDTGADEGEASTLADLLREWVRRSRHAVLIRSECLGVCARAPAVVVIRGSGMPGRPGHGLLFGPVEGPAQVRGLLQAVTDADDG